MARRRHSFGLSLVIWVAVLSFSLPLADEPGSGFRPRFQYSAEVVCGFNPPGSVLRIVPGQYATTVNIHNPNNRVELRMKLALVFPPAAQAPGPVSGFTNHELGRDEGLQVDCQEIPSEFFPGATLPPYVMGFLVIESDRSIDVIASYTAGDPNGSVHSIDVERVRERRIRREDD